MKNYRVNVNGTEYEVAIEEISAGEVKTTAKAEAPAPKAPAAAGAGEKITAPMPGNILSVNVSAGQTVKSGEVLMILEAMKMENEIMAPRDGTVAQVVTAKGAKVETGSPLVVLA